MAILNWFGKKQERVRKAGVSPVKAAQDGKEKTVKPAVLAKKDAAADSPKKQTASASSPSRVAAHTVLRGAHITEKSALAQQDGKYTFDIFPGAESPTVRQAVESVYKVHVQNVQIVKVRPQKRHRGRFASLHKRPDKAIVTLRKGETIDIMA